MSVRGIELQKYEIPPEEFEKAVKAALTAGELESVRSVPIRVLGSTLLLEKLDLELRQGEVIAVVGRHGCGNKPVRPRKSLSSADRWQPTCRYRVCGYRGAQSYLGLRSQGRRRRRSRCWATLQMMWSPPDCQLMPTSPLATPAASLPDLFA